MGWPMIEVEGLAKEYDEVPALRGVDLTVEEGTVLALIGANGAGKTTLVRILTTLLVPDAGRAAVGGWDVVDSGDRVRSMIGVTGQYAAVDERLTGRENLDLIGRLYHVGRLERRRRTDELLTRLSLSDVGDRRVGTYSGGMRRRLDIAAGLVGEPPVVILDEPTAGLDPRTRNTVWEVIRERSAHGATVLLTTQYLEEADRLADRLVLIEKGSTVAAGTADQLKDLVGSTVLEARVRAADAECALALLAELGQRRPSLDADSSASRPRESGRRCCPRCSTASPEHASRSLSSACAGPRSTRCSSRSQTRAAASLPSSSHPHSHPRRPAAGHLQPCGRGGPAATPVQTRGRSPLAT